MLSGQNDNSYIEPLDLIKKGDKKAFESVFKAYYQDLVNYSHQFIQLQAISEEIVQDVFVSYWERRDTVEIKSSLKSYLYRAVKNRTINYIRLQLPKDQKTSDIDEVPIMVAEESAGEDLSLLHKLISSEINKLPAKCRTIFLLSRTEGLSHKEIAEELDLSVKTIENQIGIALKRLREVLRPQLKRMMIMVVIILSNLLKLF
ncbi:MAG: RNA polymerase sigma-70 factor [bacterium]|nr:RNA polymerase sigma-70 factor [bacterium]